jgi:predicted ATPase with chaperone activity
VKLERTWTLPRLHLHRAPDQTLPREDLRILKVSKTIADLESCEKVEMHHVVEAINYRAFDQKLFG